MNLTDFIMLIDFAQDENTNVIVSVDGEEVYACTLENAQNECFTILNYGQKSEYIVESFVFCDTEFLIECILK